MVLQGKCADDLQFPIPEGGSWDEISIPRAFEIADKLIAKGANDEH